jgi:hypothetical protein
MEGFSEVNLNWKFNKKQFQVSGLLYQIDHPMSALNNAHLSPTILEAWKSKMKLQEDPVSGEGQLPGLQVVAIFSVCPHTTKRREERQTIC